MLQARHPRARRRAAYAPRLVTVGASLLVERASPYLIGLTAVKALAKIFPDFFAQHVAQQRLTPGVLYGCSCALLRLVNEELVELEEPWELDTNRTRDPAKLITYRWPDSDDDLLNRIEESAHHIAQPRVIAYGVGVQLYGDAGGHTLADYDLLTLALWYTAQGTQRGLGISWPDLLPGFRPWGNLLLDLPILPRVDMEQLALDLDARPLWVRTPGGERFSLDGDLLGYAFGATGIDLADYNNMEIDYLYGGDLDDTWDQIHDIAETAQVAQAIVARYHQLNAVLEAYPALLESLIRRLVVRGRRVLRTGPRETGTTPGTPHQPRTLVAALVGTPLDDDTEPGYVRAWLGGGGTDGEDTD